MEFIVSAHIGPDQIIAYDNEGKRHYPLYAHKDRSTDQTRVYFHHIEAEDIKTIQIHVYPKLAKFKNIPTIFPKHLDAMPDRSYPELYDRIAKRLAISLPKNKKELYSTLSAEELIEVLDLVDGSEMWRAVEVLRNSSEPVKFNSLEPEQQAMVRKTLDSWLDSGFAKKIYMAVRIGICLEMAEYIEPAVEMYLEGVYVKGWGGRGSVLRILRGRNIVPSAEQLERLKDKLDSRSAWTLMLLCRKSKSNDPDLQRVLDDYIQDERTYIWWPAVIGRYDKSIFDKKEFKSLDEKTQIRLMIALIRLHNPRMKEKLIKELQRLLMYELSYGHDYFNHASSIIYGISRYCDPGQANRILLDYLQAADEWYEKNDEELTRDICRTVCHVVRELNELHGLDVGGLGTTKNGNYKKVPENMEQLKTLIDEALESFKEKPVIQT